MDANLTVNHSEDRPTQRLLTTQAAAQAQIPPRAKLQADRYENWEPNFADAAQADIVTYRTAADAHFYYFRFNRAGW